MHSPLCLVGSVASCNDDGMALAHQLAELVAAHANGLLSDDEFRILRRAAFEQDVYPSAPAPFIADNPVSPRRKRSFVSGVSTLLRRATSRSKSSLVPTPASPLSNQSPELPSPVPVQKNFHRLSVIPRLQRRASGLFSSPKRPTSAAFPTLPSTPPPSRPSSTPPTSPLARQPQTPTTRSRKSSCSSPPRLTLSTSFPVSIPLTSDIFSDHNLHTSASIRAAIAHTESEAERVADAFVHLESSTAFRIQQETARRLPSATPADITVLLDGTDWRDHSPHSYTPPVSAVSTATASSSSSASAFFISPTTPSSLSTLADRASVHSTASSHKSTLSQSRSFSSLRTNSLRMSKCPIVRVPPITRNSLIPSEASVTLPSTPSRLSVATHMGSGRTLSHSRSASHLTLSILPEDKVPPPSPPPAPASEVFDMDLDSKYAEIEDIQRRRAEVMARYAARLGYLRARLKSAQLHEKLVKS